MVQMAKPATQPSHPFAGPKQAHTSKRQCQCTLEEYQVHLAVQSKSPHVCHLLPLCPEGPTGSFSSLQPSSSHVTDTFNWADDINYTEFGYNSKGRVSYTRD